MVDFNHNINFKALFMVDEKLRGFGPHFPRYKDPQSRSYVMADKLPVNIRFLGEKPYTKYARIALERAQVNHYAVKSFEEFLWRGNRGRGAQSLKQSRQQPRHNSVYFQRMDQNDVHMPMTPLLATETRKMMHHLYINSGLQDLLPSSYFGL